MGRRSWQGLVALAVPAVLAAALPCAAGAQTVIHDGETVQGQLTANDTRLSDGSYSRMYAYRGRAGDRIRITLRSRSFDSFLMIGPSTNPSASQVVSDDDGAGGTDSQLIYTIPADDGYGIVANTTQAGATGSYTLSVELVNSAGATGATGAASRSSLISGSIAPGQTLQGELTPSDVKLDDGSYADYFTFTGQAGGQITATMRSRVFDTYMVVGRWDGSRFTSIQSNDDGGGGTDSRVAITLPETGTYAIRANTLSAGKTGTYTVSLETGAAGGTTTTRTTSVTVPDAAPILPGQTVQGELSSSDTRLSDDSYADYYAFDGRAGQRVRVTLRSRAFDSYMVFGRLNGSQFTSLESNDDGGGGQDSQVTYTLPENGTYAVRANTLRARQTGAYTIGLELVSGEASGSSGTSGSSPAASGSAIGLGQTLRGALDASDSRMADGSYYQDFIYHGQADERITITLRASGFDAYLKFGRTVDGNYRELGSDDDSAGGTDSRLVFTLPESGDYVIRVNTLFKDKTGPFTVTVER
jgi:hypothetical protein